MGSAATRRRSPLVIPLLLLLALLAGCGQDGPQGGGAVGVSGGLEATLDHTAISVVRGERATLDLTLAPEDGFHGTVELSLAGAPPGVALATSELQLASATPRRERLVIVVAEHVPPAVYSLTLEAKSRLLRHSLPFTLRVSLPEGAATPVLEADRTGLPKEGGQIRLSWETPGATGVSLVVEPTDGVLVDGHPYAAPVPFPSQTTGATLTLPANPGGDTAPLGYTVTLLAHGPPGTEPARATLGVAVGGVSTGSLAVAMDGLPEGTAGAVTVAGLGHEHGPVTATTVLTGLTPGPYEISATEVESGGIVYAATTNPAQVSVQAAQVASATVLYSPLAPAVTRFDADRLTLGPAGGEVTLDWDAVSAGEYTLTVTPDDFVTGLPDGATRERGATVTLPANDSLTAPQAYEFTLTAAGAGGAPAAEARLTVTVGPLVSGTVDLTIEGVSLHTADPPVVTLRNERGDLVARQRTDGHYRLQGLTPGTYHLAAPGYSDDFGNAYAADLQPGAAFTLDSHGTVNAAVLYASPTGALAVRAGGLPDGESPDLSATGPSGTVELAEGAPTVLAPGSYRLSADDVRARDGFVYAATPSTGQEVTVASGQLTTVEAHYHPASGAVLLELQLPPGVVADVALTCENRSEGGLTAGGLVPYLEGDCVVTAGQVTADGVTYRPSPDEALITVPPGQLVPALVLYEPAPPQLTDLAAEPAQLPAAGGELTLTWQGENVRSYQLEIPELGGAPIAVHGSGVEVRLPVNDSTAAREYRLILTAVGEPRSGLEQRVTREAIVTVAPGAGWLELSISGLPAGAAPDVEVASAADTLQLAASGILELPAGEYGVRARAVEVEGSTYSPTVIGAPVTVTGGATHSVVVVYDQEFQERSER